MRFEVLTHFFGQEVEVAILSKTFTGILRQSEMDDGLEDVVEIEPSSDYARKRHGSAVLDVDTITSIRLLKPHTGDDEDDCCEKAV
jgi:hypothetical protein